jgi:hypothetical protein
MEEKVVIAQEMVDVTSMYPHKHEGVHGIVATLKIKNGRLTDKMGLTFLVEKKKSKQHLNSADQIPDKFMGIDTDVIEREPTVMISSGCIQYHGSPANGGTCGAYINFGSESDQFGLTCHHVVSSYPNQPVYGSPIYSSDCGAPSIGTVHSWQPVVYGEIQPPVNEVDVAILKMNSNVNPQGMMDLRCGYDNRKVSRQNMGTIAVGMSIWKCGRTSRYSTGTILGIGTALVHYEGSSSKRATFKNVIIPNQGMTAVGGDSGSLLCTFERDSEGKYLPIGLIFGSGGISSQLSKIRQYLGFFNISQRSSR